MEDNKKNYLSLCFNDQGKLEVKEMKYDFDTVPKDHFLIDVKYSALHNFDIYNLESGGKFGPLGAEGSGVIVKAGEGCDNSLVGQNVCFTPKLSHDQSGTYSQLTAKHKDNVYPVGDLDLKKSAFLIGNPRTAYYQFKTFVIDKGVKSVLQDVGSSALGKMITSLCIKHGITILNIVRKAENLKFLEDVGSKLNYNSKDPNFTTSINNAIKEHQPTVYFSYLGGKFPSTLFEKLPRDSSMIIMGNITNSKMSGFSSIDFIFKGKIIETFDEPYHVAQLPLEEVNKAMKEIIESVKIGDQHYVTNIIKEFYLFEEFEDAIKEYKANQSRGKVVFRLTK
jgi:NADPH:quinone reductase-like Zn-dependent oxidoreductase